ncbi:MAG: UpxY family transcription antiterminator [Candidatus Acidiferrum sp.]
MANPATLKLLTSPIHLPWFALHVHSGKEGWIYAHLSGQGYECFLPKYKTIRQWSDRKKQMELALFPGYLFCRFDPLVRLPVLKTPGVIQVVGCNRTPVAIEEKEIQAIQRMVESGLPTEPWPYLAIGDRVQIQSGALRGLEGILVSVKGNRRLVLSVTLLQRSVAVEVDSGAVEASADHVATRKQHHSLDQLVAYES